LKISDKKIIAITCRQIQLTRSANRNQLTIGSDPTHDSISQSHHIPVHSAFYLHCGYRKPAWPCHGRYFWNQKVKGHGQYGRT